MGIAKRIGIVVLVYLILGLLWSVMMHLGFLPSPGGLDGPLNILYIVFQPVSFIYFMIMISLGLL